MHKIVFDQQINEYVYAMTDKPACKYPDCVDNGPEGKCTDWLIGVCKGPTTDDKPTRGRPPKPADQQTHPFSIRLTLEQIAKLKAIGVDRLRAWIDRAKVKSGDV